MRRRLNTCLLYTSLDERVRRYLQIFQTSSPSYIFMQSMEKAVAFGANNRDGSVSYTHLDVYKRQTLYISAATGQGLPELANAIEEILRNQKSYIRHTFASVSYTHLDVYKRQLTPRAMHSGQTRHLPAMIQKAIPVSDTHLDVYKRQDYISAC